MIIRNGQVLGSVVVADLKAARPVAEPVVVEPVVEPEPVVEVVEDVADSAPVSEVLKPKVYGSKAEWVAYAVSLGADADEAAELSKADLVGLYG